MTYNILGDTEIAVSTLGFGASGVGGMFDKTDEKEAIRTIHKAFERGINYFDTSPAYGRNNSTFGPVTSEIILGEGLKSLDRSKIVLSSKAGKIASLPPAFNFNYDAIINSVEASLKRLQTDYIDIVFLHDIEYDGGKYLNIAMNQGLKALKRLKNDGKIRFFGISCYSIEVLHKVLDNYDIDAVLIHNHYTLINNELLELIPKVKSKGIGLVSASPFASGLLTRKGPPDWYPVTKKELCHVKQALDFCNAKKISIEKIALQFSLGNSEIPTTLFSCTDQKTLDQNIDWIEEPVNEKMIEDICSILGPLRNMDFDFGAYND